MADPPELFRGNRPLSLLAGLLAGRPASGTGMTREEWGQFVLLAIDRHRVAPATEAAITRCGLAVPEDVSESLGAAARECTIEALNQKTESFRLVSALAAQGVRPIMLKGWPLAEALYGSAGMRHAKDLDLLILPEEIDPCLSVLGALGYGIDPEHSARGPLLGAQSFRTEFNDLAFWNPEVGIQAELHWRSQHFRGWPDLATMRGIAEERSLDNTGVSLRVPTARANLVYLAQHGQQHLWQRLKWLLDIARLLASQHEEVLMADLAAAQAVRGARAVVIAGHLARHVLGAPLPRRWPEPGVIEARAVGHFCRAISAPAPVPGTLRARLGYYGASLALAETAAQRAGVLRYALWRRMRFPGVT